MSTKIRAAIVGYGNVGRFTLSALQAAEDFAIAGVVRRFQQDIPLELQNYPVVSDIEKLESVDVALLCVPTRSIAIWAEKLLQQGINTVDSFDIHSQITSLRARLDPIAKQHHAVAVIAAGWDPGSDSMIRAIMYAMAPNGITHTNFGPGMSMGHSVAAKEISGVKDALSITIPLGSGIHRRMVYVELEQETELTTVTQLLKEDPYFRGDEVQIKQVDNVTALKDMGHGVYLTHTGVSGMTHNQQFEFKMRVNNPALTAQFMVSAARASLKQKSGAYTVIELPPIDFLQGERETWIEKLV